MSVVAPLIRNITSNWAALGVNLVVSFFLAPFVVHALGNTYYGIWAVIMQFTGYLYLLDFGVRDSVIRYTAKLQATRRTRSLNRTLTAALMLYAPITVIAIAASAAAAFALPHVFGIEPEKVNETRLVTLLVGLTIAQTFLFNVFTGVLLGFQRFDLNNLVGVVTALLRAGLIVVFLSMDFRIVALAAIQLGITLCQGVLWVYLASMLLRRNGMALKLEKLGWRRFSAIGKRLFGFSIYVFINNVGQKVTVASDAVVIGLFMPVAAVTYYAIAGNLIGYLRQLVRTTAQVFSPMTSHHAALREMDMVRSGLTAGSKLLLTVTVPVVGAYVFMGREFIGLWMGAEYMQKAGDVLIILAATQLLSAPHQTMSNVLYGLSRHRVLAYLRIGEAVVNLVLSIILIHYLGLVGVALGTAIPHTLLVFVILPAITARIVGMSLTSYAGQVYVRPLLAAIPYCAGAYWFNAYLPAGSLLTFFAQVALLCSGYVALCYALVLNPNERAWVNALAGRAGVRLTGTRQDTR
jgi:O-antigen/teichoic acid export membrane protein